MQTTTDSFARIVTSTFGAEQSSLSSQNVGSVTGQSLGLTQSSSIDQLSFTTNRLLTTQAPLMTQRNETILSTTQAQVATVQTYKTTETQINTQFVRSFATKQTPMTTEASVTMQTPVLLTTHLMETSNVSGATQPLTVISHSPSTTLGTITTQDHITASQTSGSPESTVASQTVSTVWTYTTPQKSTTQSAPSTHALETNGFIQHTVTTPAVQTTKNPVATFTSQASLTTQTHQTMQGSTSQASQTTLVSLTTQASQKTVTQTSQLQGTAEATRTTQAQTAQFPQTTQIAGTTQVPHTTQVLSTPQTFKTAKASQTSQASVTTPSIVTTPASHTTQGLFTTLGLVSLEASQKTVNAKPVQDLSTTLSFNMTEDHSMTVIQTTQTTTTPITFSISARFLTESITAMQASMASQVSATNQKTISTLGSSATSTSVAKATSQTIQTSSVSTTHNPTDTQASLKTAQTSVTGEASTVIPESQTPTVSVTRWDGNGSSATGALTSGPEYTVVATNPVDSKLVCGAL